MIIDFLEIIILTLINSGGIFLVILLAANSLKVQINKWFAIMIISILGWVDFAYLGYNYPDNVLALIFYRLNWAFVSVFFFAEYMLYIESFLKINRPRLKFFIFILSLIFFVLSLFSNTIISEVHWKGWGNEIIFGPVNDIFSLFAFSLNIVVIVLLAKKFFKFKAEEKRKVSFFLAGTVITIFFNVLFNIISPEIFKTAQYQHFGDYSAVFFLIFTAFAIIRRKFMDVKIALAALLIGIMSTLLIFDIFALSHNLFEQTMKFGILIFFAIISTFLVRSVLSEIRQKEQLAKANTALEKSKQRYIDLATEQKDIIDVMGHEIRTPLTAITQGIKLHKKYTLPIEDQLLKEAKSSELLTQMLPLFFDVIKTTDRASAHAVALVTDMLETARLDKQRFELNYEKFDLVDLVRSNVDLMSKTVENDNKNIKYEITFKNPRMKSFEVEADKTRIGQAIVALLSNAIKYHDPEKNTVRVQVSLTREENFAYIEFTDNGIGIDANDISKLGKKFLRLNPKPNGNLKRPGGTGLGLFVVKGIMEYHHGELIISSDGIGKGSTFVLKTPIVRVNK